MGKGAISSGLDRRSESGVAAQPVSEWGRVLKVEMTTVLRGLPSDKTGSGGLHAQRLSTFGTSLWNDTLCGCGIATSLDYALYSTFTALYDTMGGISSGAIIPLSLRKGTTEHAYIFPQRVRL